MLQTSLIRQMSMDNDVEVTFFRCRKELIERLSYNESVKAYTAMLNGFMGNGSLSLLNRISCYRGDMTMYQAMLNNHFP